ncbi:MAG: ASPIC/UnbV domain-containing protein [Chloroflexi bacterium]|nr:ASPIC/UnbV domain-containing protein [Chloroflexota bacterium]
MTISSSYLSGDPGRVHFGFLPGTTPERLTIIWNDGEYSVVDELRANTLITVRC